MKRFLKSISVTVVLISIFTFTCFSEENIKIFTDISVKEWYAESVDYVYKNGLMNGTSSTTFEPETKITRGMIVTIIYRLEGSPDVEGILNFSDVNKNYYYSTPIIWASENGIVNGVSKDAFVPDAEITREQFATILYRYARYKGLDVSVDENEYMKKYSDTVAISDYAEDAMSWANYTKLITGVTTTTLVPQGLATRSQAATIFMRFDKLCYKLTQQENESSSESNTDEQDYQGSVSDENNKIDNSTEAENTQKPDEDKKENEVVYTEPTLVVGNVSAKPGQSVEVPVLIKNNPGVAGATFTITYDSNLVLINATTASAFSKLDYTGPGKFTSPCNFTWDSEDGQANDDGVFLNLIFVVSDEAKKYDKLNIECSYRYGDVFNENWEDLTLKIVTGGIIIE